MADVTDFRAPRESARLADIEIREPHRVHEDAGAATIRAQAAAGRVL